MSHSTVCIRVPSDVSISGVHQYVDDILRPYNEQGEPGDEFMEFVDETENYRIEFETKGTDQVQIGDKFFYPWDDEAKKEAKSLGRELETINRSFKDIYGTFEDFVKKYHGAKANDDGQYGYWHNPNAKWDWWVIGGRWSGHWPVKTVSKDQLGRSGSFDNAPTPGGVDITRIKDIDFERADIQTSERVSEFIRAHNEYYESGKEPSGNPFSGPRHDGLDLGLIQCLNDDEITDEIQKTCKLSEWPVNRRQKAELPRYDVISPLSETEEFKTFLYNHFNKLSTYARLDSVNGWVEPGAMGWWGMSHATPDTLKEYGQSFMEWLKSGNQEDWVVVVDVHI